MMRAAFMVLIMLMTAFIFSGTGCREEGENGIAGVEEIRLLTMSADTKKIEEKMAGALNDMMSYREQARAKSEDYGQRGINPTASFRAAAQPPPVNSSAVNASDINASIINPSANNSSAINESAASFSANSSANSALRGPSAMGLSPSTSGRSAGQQGIGSSSRTDFKGYYGISSSQHQMGEGNVDSSTFLSGTFSMEKSVKFQDRGI